MNKSLDIDPDELSALCLKYEIKSLSLFGSVLKGTARPESDIDLLIEFLPDARPTFIDMAAIEIELSRMLGGRKVDVRTAEDLSVYFREDVVKMAEPQYVAR